MPTPNASSETTIRHPSEGMITLAHVIYALHAFSALTGLASSVLVLTAFLTGWPSIIAVILNYAKRSEVRDVAGFAFRLADPHVLVCATLAVPGRGGVRDDGRDSGGARGVDRDGAVGALPHRARLDDAFLGEADAAAGRGLGEQSEVLESEVQLAAGTGVRCSVGDLRG